MKTWYKEHKADVNVMILVCAAAVLVRFVFLGMQFTHLDDVGVASLIVQARDTNYVSAFFTEKLGAETGTNGLNPRVALLQRIGKQGYLQPFIKVLQAAYPYLCVAAERTYAPVQFLVTPLLVSSDYSYRTNIFMGRLPSCLAGVAAIFAMAWLMCLVNKHEPGPYVLITSAVMGLSLEHVLFSMHMSNYALGVLALIIMLFTLRYNVMNPSLSLRRALGNGAILVGLLYCHYQVFMFVPAFLAVLFFYAWSRNRARGIRVMAMTAITASVFGLGFFPVYWLRMRDALTTTWNAGPSGEYLLNVHGEGLLNGVVSGMVFFLKNSFVVFSSMVSCVPEDSGVFLPVALISSMAAIIGFAALFRDQDINKRCFAYFILGAAVIWGGLVLLGKLTLSPTRHSLILLPIFTLMIAEGFVVICRSFKCVPWGCRLVPLVMLVLFLWNLPLFMGQRMDPFDESRLRQMMSQYKISFIVSDGMADNLRLMPGLASMPVYDLAGGDWERKGKLLDGQSILVMSRARRLPTEINSKVADEIKQSAGVKNQILPMPDEYAVIEREEFQTDAEMEFSGRTKNQSNGLFMYVMQGKDRRVSND